MEQTRSFSLENEAIGQNRSSAIQFVTTRGGEKIPFDEARLRQFISESCAGFEDVVSSELIYRETERQLFNGIGVNEIMQAAIMATRPFVESEPAYSFVAARLLLQITFDEVLGMHVDHSQRLKAYQEYFPRYLEAGIAAERLNPQLKSDFDVTKIAQAIKPERDELFNFLGLQTLYDRYFIHIEKRRIELPQVFWMRVAMGLALVEKTLTERTERAIEFYNLLSQFDYVSSTPTLFNSGSTHSQLSSCFLTTVPDDLRGIYGAISDNAMLSKFSGGLGNDWTPVRGLGAWIKGTNGSSQGVIPFLKVANDTAIAVNQGGKRKGAVCSYLETWHIDIEEYLELRKNTGDERRRTHDMNTANWIPDLFMKRVETNGQWTLFSPEETPDLHDLYGKKFEEAYTAYEEKAARGEIRNFRTLEAVKLWRKMLSMVFETGHPWITFKDPSNLRSPQQHVGVVHSSNLCTEILLNTNQDEVAVCNLGSINLKNHMIPGKGLDNEKLRKTVKVALRMLDNVIDQNYYPVPQAKNSNLKHRPVGMGIMGFQDALYMMRIPYESPEAANFADRSMEAISYHAILASSELAQERGPYASYKGSLWDKGILPIDSIETLENERGNKIQVSREVSMDWKPVRESIKKYGMRNSNCMAIAPTATISNISGVTQSIEPTYKNLFVKSNMSGEFVFINSYLVADLKKLKLWDKQMVNDLKKYDGDVEKIERIPESLKALYRTAFQIDPKALIDCAARRQKWIDMGQSLNLYLEVPNGKKLHDTYLYAWNTGLKTTYYLRSMGASSIEKSTITTREYNNVAPVTPVKAEAADRNYEPKFCSIDNPECESCQ
jgi:ribonucleoside-diphosphate reductase alpha chain